MTKYIKVFLSYQWAEDKNTRAYLASLIDGLSETEPVYDINNIRQGEYIHPTISSLIDDSDCIIVPATSLESMEVASELILANERKKKIFLICAESKSDSIRIPNHLWFLNDLNKIIYKDFDELKTQIHAEFKGKKRIDFLQASPELAEIARKIDKDYDKKLVTFRKELIDEVLKEASKEIEEILDVKGRYEIDVGIEKNFLTRALSIFSNAERVYAVSFDSVSTFWTDTHSQSLAKRYIVGQPNTTIRLFVFSDPAKAHYYSRILEASRISYGEKGKVLICSTETYKVFMKQYGNYFVPENKGLFTQDFGILTYANDDGNVLLAKLDKSQLKFERVSLHKDTTNIKGLMASFEKLRNSHSEKTFQVNGEENRIMGVWSDRYLYNKRDWGTMLGKLFPEYNANSVKHMVFFKNLDSNAVRILHKIKDDLQRLSEELRIQRLWLGKSTDNTPVADFNYKGNIKIDAPYQYVLVMDFMDQADLDFYYMDKEHSNIRHILYKSFGDALRLLYKYMDQQLEDNVRSTFFENVVE